MRNEKGSTLIQVLLVILIFSVLGISLIVNVVGENKRVNKTDDNVQSRNLVRDGLTYFEADFNKTVHANAGFIDIYKFLYVPDDEGQAFSTGKVVKIDNEDILIKTEIVPPDFKQPASDAFIIKVTIQIINSKKYEEESLHGYYTVDFDVDFKTAAVTLGDLSNAEELDVSKALVNLKNLSLNKLGLGALIGHLNLEQTISLSLLPYGSYQDFYPLPDDKLLDGLVGTGGIDLLNIINLKGSANTFNHLKNMEAVAVRNTSLIRADVDTNNLELLGLIDFVADIGIDLQELYLNLSLIDLQNINNTFKPTNVMINGGFGGLDLSTTSLVSSLETTLGGLLNNLGLGGKKGGLLGGLLDGVFDLLGGVTGILDKLADGLFNILNDGINGRTGYEDITIKKLGITGHGLITQGSDDKDQRAVAFTNGLFVKQSLNIGAFSYKKEEVDGLIETGPARQLNQYSNLSLNGDMLATDRLNMNNADLEFIKSNLYVYDILGKHSNDAMIRNSCIKLSDSSESHFNLLVNGKINIKYNGNDAQQCRTLSGYISLRMVLIL